MTYQQLEFKMPQPKNVHKVKCPCCGHEKITYTRRMNSNMALCVHLLWKHKINGYVKVEDFLLENGHKRCGDFSYLTHYGMIKKMEGKRNDGSSKNGYYQLTGIGIMFAEGRLAVQEKFKICENKFEGFEGKEIYIHQVHKFSYDELINDSSQN